MSKKSNNARFQKVKQLLAGYKGVRETTFTATHPEVIRLTNYFHERLGQEQIFEAFDAKHPTKSLEKAAVVAVLWHSFSEFMPWFLCHASASVSNNRLRHYVIQTAFEELGMRDVTEIHHEMFWKLALSTGITEENRKQIENDSGIERVICSLRSGLILAHSNAEILGMLLGLEIPAQENIENIFQALARTPELETTLSHSMFFKLHRKLEIEHIRLDVSVFLRFCTTDDQKDRFIHGFDKGVRFWRDFWTCVSNAITEQEKRSVKSA